MSERCANKGKQFFLVFDIGIKNAESHTDFKSVETVS
jgi:hypothetical protein